MEAIDISHSKILLVDDTSANLIILSTYLKRQGFEPLTANNGRQALDMSHEEIPDLILLDVMMPGMDGFEVCRQLKQDETTQDIPIVFMTSLSEVENKVKGFEVGAVDYVTKPFEIREVLVRVNTHLTIRSLQKQVEQKNEQLHQQNLQLQAEIRRRQELEAQLRYESLHDSLTGLPNRAMFTETLTKTINQTTVGQGDFFALFFLDLDGFKSINDTFGHQAGDELLHVVARRLLRCVRVNDLVARLAGDEFTIILNKLYKTEEATQVAERIKQQLSEPILIQEKVVNIGVSMGITFGGLKPKTFDEILHEADLAMYEAKVNREQWYHFAEQR